MPENKLNRGEIGEYNLIPWNGYASKPAPDIQPGAIETPISNDCPGRRGWPLADNATQLLLSDIHSKNYNAQECRVLCHFL
jgi:hypothetical protein